MPNDILRWEHEGALVHHCPVCKTPLSNPRSRKRCLGEHVEWCHRYHHQLFKKGGSIQCMACNNSDDQQDRRCRNIAELIQQLRLLAPLPNLAIASPTASPASPSFPSPGVPGSATKKDRKDAKKAAKAAARPPPIRAADIKRIGLILHPVDENEDEDFEQALLKDEDINLNKYYHRGTANTREMRHHFIQQTRSASGEVRIPEAEMQRILGELKIREPAKANKVEKGIVDQIKKAIREDLVHVHGGDQQTMLRKGSFWRWASRKAYDRLVENGMIWDHKIKAPLPEKADAFAGAAIEREEMPEADGDLIEAVEGLDLSNTTPELSADDSDASRGGPASTPNTSRDTSASSEPRGRRLLREGPQDDDDGWTPIGKAKSGLRAKAPPPVKVKLAANHGLGHLMTKSTPRFALGQIGRFCDEDEDDDDE